jgi:hypothetical protein
MVPPQLPLLLPPLLPLLLVVVAVTLWRSTTLLAASVRQQGQAGRAQVLLPVGHQLPHRSSSCSTSARREGECWTLPLQGLQGWCPAHRPLQLQMVLLAAHPGSTQLLRPLLAHLTQVAGLPAKQQLQGM